MRTAVSFVHLFEGGACFLGTKTWTTSLSSERLAGIWGHSGARLLHARDGFENHQEWDDVVVVNRKGRLRESTAGPDP